MNVRCNSLYSVIQSEYYKQKSNKNNTTNQIVTDVEKCAVEGQYA